MQERAVTKDLPRAETALADGDHDAALRDAQADLPLTEDKAAMLRVIVRVHLANGKPDAAEPAVQALRAFPLEAETLNVLLDFALARHALQEARALLAMAESVGIAPPIIDAQIKARIAMAGGDFAAAKAILTPAIETYPDAVPLRALMTEVMVAGGNASDVRAVLSHLGRPPSRPAAPAKNRTS